MEFIPARIALSCGVPLGLLIALVGAVLFFVTKRKAVAITVCSVGALIIAGTIGALFSVWRM